MQIRAFINTFCCVLLTMSTTAAVAHPMNQTQSRGTHNSYHLYGPAASLYAGLSYEHDSLSDQLSAGARQLELDVRYHEGGRFSSMHIPVLDDKSRCLDLSVCLDEVAAWSNTHPDHEPILIWLELKSTPLDIFVSSIRPIQAHLPELESLILRHFSRAKLLVPDDVLQNFATLPEAIAARGWPDLDSVRGKIFVSLLANSTERLAYLGPAGDPKGKLFFVNADDETQPFAALFKIDDPIRSMQRIRKLVAKGFLITALVDTPGGSDAANFARAKAGIDSGAQYLSTNFLRWRKRRLKFLEDSLYWFDLKGAQP